MRPVARALLVAALLTLTGYGAIVECGRQVDSARAPAPRALWQLDRGLDGLDVRASPGSSAWLEADPTQGAALLRLHLEPSAVVEVFKHVGCVPWPYDELELRLRNDPALRGLRVQLYMESGPDWRQARTAPQSLDAGAAGLRARIGRAAPAAPALEPVLQQRVCTLGLRLEWPPQQPAAAGTVALSSCAGRSWSAVPSRASPVAPAPAPAVGLVEVLTDARSAGPGVSDQPFGLDFLTNPSGDSPWLDELHRIGPAVGRLSMFPSLGHQTRALLAPDAAIEQSLAGAVRALQRVGWDVTVNPGTRPSWMAPLSVQQEEAVAAAMARAAAPPASDAVSLELTPAEFGVGAEVGTVMRDRLWPQVARSRSRVRLLPRLVGSYDGPTDDNAAWMTSWAEILTHAASLGIDTTFYPQAVGLGAVAANRAALSSWPVLLQAAQIRGRRALRSEVRGPSGRVAAFAFLRPDGWRLSWILINPHGVPVAVRLMARGVRGSLLASRSQLEAGAAGPTVRAKLEMAADAQGAGADLELPASSVTALDAELSAPVPVAQGFHASSWIGGPAGAVFDAVGTHLPTSRLADHGGLGAAPAVDLFSDSAGDAQDSLQVTVHVDRDLAWWCRWLVAVPGWKTVALADVEALTFAVRAAADAPPLEVALAGPSGTTVYLPLRDFVTDAAPGWQLVRIPVDAWSLAGLAGQVRGVQWRVAPAEAHRGSTHTYQLDDVALLRAVGPRPRVEAAVRPAPR